MTTQPPRALESAKWWADFRPGTGNLDNWHPEPATVEYAPDALQWFVDSRKQCEEQYALAEGKDDAVGTTVWGRVNEHSRKLALLYASARNPVDQVRVARAVPELRQGFQPPPPQTSL